MDGVMNESTIAADVLLHTSVPAADAEYVKRALGAVGVDITLKVAPVQRGFNEVIWAALVVLPLNTFITSVVGRLGEDAHEALRNLVSLILRRLHQQHTQENPLILQDTNTGLQIVLPEGLALDAYQQLLNSNALQATQGGLLQYDAEEGCWSTTRT